MGRGTGGGGKAEGGIRCAVGGGERAGGRKRGTGGRSLETFTPCPSPGGGGEFVVLRTILAMIRYEMEIRKYVITKILKRDCPIYLRGEGHDE